MFTLVGWFHWVRLVSAEAALDQELTRLKARSVVTKEIPRLHFVRCLHIVGQ